MAAPSDARPEWVEVTVRVAPADVELVADALREVAPGGVVIEPAIRRSDDANFAYEELDAPSTLRACVEAPWEMQERDALRYRVAALPLSAPASPLVFRDVSARDWSEEWKRYWDVWHSGGRIVVRPSWEPYRARPGELVIELDPGAAFGTGQHETTRLCLVALERHVRRGARVLDLGAGSGILAIAAARLGAASVLGVDVDADTVAVARANAIRNGIGARTRFAAGSLGDAWPWRERAERSFDLVVANISSPVIVDLLPQIAAALRPGGLFVGSGFIDANEAEVGAAAAAAGLRALRGDAYGEWRCLIAAFAPHGG